MIYKQLHWSESYTVCKIWLSMYPSVFHQSVAHLAHSCLLLTISTYSCQIRKSPGFFFFFILPAVLFCHAHFKIYLFFRSDGLCLKAGHYPPALSQRNGAKKGKRQVHHSQHRDAKEQMTTVTFGKRHLFFQIAFHRSWKKKKKIDFQ